MTKRKHPILQGCQSIGGVSRGPGSQNNFRWAQQYCGHASYEDNLWSLNIDRNEGFLGLQY